MFSFLKNKPKEEQTMCVLLVNSYSVTAAVVRTYHREGAVAKPVVLFSCEEKIPHHHLFDASSFQEGDGGRLDHLVETQIKQTLEKCRKVHGNYDRLVCVVGEPWVMTKTRHITLEKPKPFKITQKIIDEALVRDSRLFEQEAVRDYAQDEEWGVIHSTRPTTTINGYTVTNPAGMVTKSMEIHTNISVAPAVFLEMVVGAYVDVFHRTDVSFVGGPVVYAKLMQHQGTGAVIDLGGISGSLMLFNQGILEHSETIPAGLAVVEDAIAHLFGIHHAHSASVMKFADDEKLLEHERDVYYQRIESAYKNLGAEIRLAVFRMKKQTGTIPGRFIFNPNPSWASVLRPFLETDTGATLMIPQPEMFDEDIVYTHSVRIKHVQLSLAIMAALEK